MYTHITEYISMKHMICCILYISYTSNYVVFDNYGVLLLIEVCFSLEKNGKKPQKLNWSLLHAVKKTTLKCNILKKQVSI